ncbi:hypothetical protein [Salinicola avicenniae]|uniref:hypothetical protein n=1 Tax=Salinicola avicenniae TaxID=2916836 RepID=UPI0020744EA1|nr:MULTISPECIES: hypothetical protein [unclassified Salinicola]
MNREHPLKAFIRAHGFTQVPGSGQDFELQDSFMIEVDREFPVFITHPTMARVVFFTFVADLERLSRHDGFLVMSESLSLNAFNHEQAVQYCLEASGRYVLAWTSRALARASFAEFEEDLSALEGAYRLFARAQRRLASATAPAATVAL